MPLLLGNSSRTTVAAFRMLSSSPNRNPNPKFISSMIASQTLTPNRPPLSNPNPRPLFPQISGIQHLQTSVSRIINECRGASDNGSSSIEASVLLDDSTLVVVSFYRFADFPDHAEMRKPLKELCQRVRVSGGIILAPEGINGSICGTCESVEKVLEFIQADERLKGLRLVESPVSQEEEAIHHGHTSHSPLGAGEDAPFRWDHVRVKVKKEIVSFGDTSVMPTERVGQYVHPKDWNALISDPDIVVVDVRNTYETRIGKFKGAVDPSTTAFREFPSWVDDQFELDDSWVDDKQLDKEAENSRKEQRNNKKLPRVAMYCTGGIRCEKASSFLLTKGFEEVYHLEGGILKYLEEVPRKESLWEGECFVFDKRVSVDHGLVQGSFKLCYGCKQPVSDEDLESPLWEYGVSCSYCFSTKSEEEKERARARQRQFETWGVIGGPDKGRRNPERNQKSVDHREEEKVAS